MPYRKAHYWISGIFVVTIIGFFPSYFMRLDTAPIEFHAHAATSLIWTALVILQSWSIHHQKKALHKTVGKASFLLFPLLTASFVGIINITAEKYTSGEKFAQMMGAGFGFAMTIAIIAYLFLYYGALKYRRSVKIHAGFMLATPLVLFESPFSRLLIMAIPALRPTGPDTFYLIHISIVISMAIATAIALYLWKKDTKNGWPFAYAAGFMALEALLIVGANYVQLAHDVFYLYTSIPSWISSGVGFLLGAAAAWLGWEHGKPNHKKPQARTTSKMASSLGS
ncbi:hypothetical protein [Aestuariibacter salexigens]|uniref:hypothetical protein n=1 Tax=Aestuariibacter salexigens TaxID=226010 RepID=UPI000406261D|nr:hypothetical protein [Aestuariibacter salexigens]